MTAEFTGIQKSGLLLKSDIDPHQYTLSLLQKGIWAGLIDDSAAAQIQNSIMLLLKEMIIKFTKGASTSVKTETAERILLSILYSLDACLSRLDNPKDALDLLKCDDINHIYKEGLGLVESCFINCQDLYQHIAKHKLPVELYAYNSTLDEALPEFFGQYDPLFSAQDTWAGIDYPLLIDDWQQTGIFFIKHYLENLTIESYFCSLFDPFSINKVLYNYGRVYHIDYREPLINIAEVVLTNSIFAVISGKSALQLLITPYQYAVLLDKFKDWDNELCSLQISLAIETVLDELGINDPNHQNYIRKFTSKLLPRFLSALAHNSLSNLIILDGVETQSLDVIWDEGNRLSDDDFRLLVEQILNCSDGTCKASVIKANVHSLTDFIDVLEADCLFDNEYGELFAVLGDIELSILVRIIFIEELRNTPSDRLLQTIIRGNQFTMPWQIEFVRFLQQLNPTRIQAIEQFIHQLQT